MQTVGMLQPHYGPAAAGSCRSSINRLRSLKAPNYSRPHTHAFSTHLNSAAAAEASTADAEATLESVCAVRRAHIGFNSQVQQFQRFAR
jgi:hypothetical protein